MSKYKSMRDRIKVMGTRDGIFVAELKLQLRGNDTITQGGDERLRLGMAKTPHAAYKQALIVLRYLERRQTTAVQEDAQAANAA